MPLAALAALLGSATAEATTPPTPPTPPCDVHAVAPLRYRQSSDGSPERRRLPANLPSFLVRNGDLPLPAMRLVDASAEPAVEVPLRVDRVSSFTPDDASNPGGHYTLSPSVSVSGGGVDDVRSLLAAGHSYRLEFETECPPSAGELVSLPFEVTAAAPLPTTAGRFEVLETRTTPRSDLDDEPGSYSVAVRFTPSSELEPWLDVYEAQLTIDDGTPVNLGDPKNDVLRDDFYRARAKPDLTRDTRGFYAEGGSLVYEEKFVCDASDGWPTGLHALTLHVAPIAFAAEPLTLRAEVTLGCAQPAPPGLGGDDDDDDDDHERERPPVVREEPPPDSGCAVRAPSAPGGRALALAGLVAAAAFGARRRRSR